MAQSLPNPANEPGDAHHPRTLILDGRDATFVIKALSSDVRLQILNLLSSQILSVSDIAAELGASLAATAINVKKLEEAGLIHTYQRPGKHGSQKMCSRTYDAITIHLPGLSVHPGPDRVEVSMPVGNYKAIQAEPSCGLASEDGIIGMIDDPRSFFAPDHVFAQLIWFGRGKVTYKFPNNLPRWTTLTRLELSLEIGSEAPNYNENWPSDITLWVNGVEVGTWTCPGDFGRTRGKLTPLWWLDRYSQHGLLKSFNVTGEGAFVDGQRISDVTVNDLGINDELEVIEVTIGNREDATHPNGINIFGRKFGNYPQDIILSLQYVASRS